MILWMGSDITLILFAVIRFGFFYIKKALCSMMPLFLNSRLNLRWKYEIHSIFGISLFIAYIVMHSDKCNLVYSIDGVSVLATDNILRITY